MTRIPAYYGPRDGGKSIWPASCPIAREKCWDVNAACRYYAARTMEDEHGATVISCEAPIESEDNQ